MNEIAILIRKLKNEGVGLSILGNDIEVSLFKDDIDEEIFNIIRKNKTGIKEYIQSLNANFIYPEISEISFMDSYPISDAQRRLWVLSQFEGGSVAYNMPGNVYLNEEINIEYFKKAVDAVIARHEILRTVFKEDESGEIRQWVLTREDLDFKIDYKDFRKEKNKEEKVKNYIAEDSYKSFDLAQGPLLRASLLQVEDKRYVFYFNMHHIISDGWSMDVLSKDVFAYYGAYHENTEPGLKELRIQYKDYSGWQLAQQETELFKSHRAYWLKSLEGELPLLDLPSTKKRPRIKTYNGHGLSTYIDKATTAKLKKYSQENGGSLFMGLLAVWNILMYRYTSQKDIIIGTPIAGREHADLEDQIGFYVNTLALRNEIRAEENFDELFSRVKENTLDAYSHQMYPFDRLVEELNIPRDTSRSVVFDVMLVLQNTGEKTQGFELKEEELNRIEDRGESVSKFDINLMFEEIGDYISLQLVYNPDVYDREMIKGLINHYRQLLKALLENPEAQLSHVDYLSAEEKQKLLFSFNDTKVAYPKDKTIIDLFEEQVNKTPNNVAVVFEEKELTYKELDELSNQLADYLQKHYAIEPDDLIGIKQDRSEWMIVSILGVLKSGGAYVPIDPGYPQDRIAYIEQDTNCKVCIDEKELNKFKKGQKKHSRGKINSDTKVDNLAYVIYTSGSTGNPKGVLIEHKNVYSFIKWSHAEFSKSDFERVLFTTSLNFDLSVFEIFHTLTKGKELEVLKDGLSIPKHINDGKKLMVNTVPSVVGSLLQQGMSFASVSVLNMAGEPIPSNYKSELKGKVKEIRNLYGPSEDTTYSTVFRIDKDQRNLIGKPISNTQIYILSEEKGLQPVGVPGEICISGSGLARGYLNQEALTREKFIANPFKAGDRLYKTGDQGYWLPDGNIEFIGRKDDQVKIRGYRIELGEIEHALLKNEAIEEAVVLAKTNDNNEKELVAYLVSKEEQNTSELRSYLKGILPEYMLPVYFVQLEALPLTSNGKIDKKNLPDPKGLGLASGVEYVAPRNEIEEKLVKIWEEILQRENIGVKDDFFALGGHSLKAVRLSNEYQKALAVKISLKDLFSYTSIDSHSALIRSSIRAEFIQIENVTFQESYPISDAQRRLWVLSQFEGGSVAYNMPGSVKLEGEYTLELFQKSVDSLIARHEILRTVFKEDESGEIRQWVLTREDLDFKIDYKDFRKEKNKEEKVKNYIAEDSYKSFDLAQGPLLRASLLQVEDKRYVFYFNMHHIISDGWSMDVLSKDVFAYYGAYHENTEPGLKELRIQYKDYSGWQLAQQETELFKSHRAYWLKSLEGELPLLDLPSTKKRPRIKTYNGHGLSTYIDKATTAKLKKYSQENGGSLFMGLLAVWNILMYRYTSQKDIIIGTPIAGREHADLEDQIGFYVNTLALRNEIRSEETFDDLFLRVKQNTLDAYAHQMYPFDRLVEELNLQRDTSRSAVFDILLTLQNTGEKTQGFELKEEELNRIEDRGESVSKFDINLMFEEIGDYISFELLYNPDVYDFEMATGLIRHYKQLLKTLLENPKEKVSQIDYLSVEERQELVVTFNDTAVAYAKDKTIVDLFEEQVKNTPDNIAVVFEENELSYKKLDELSNQLAHYLHKNYNIEPDNLVGIKQDRSEWMIVSILGVLKAGGAYMPIDPDYPEDRIRYMLGNSDCKVCIDEEELASFINQKEKHSINRLESKLRSDNLAYVIYTSGSTGKPKGVMIEHRSLINYNNWFTSAHKINQKDSSIIMSSPSFDGILTCIYGCILNGGSIHLLRKEIISSPVEVIQYVRSKRISFLKATPPYLKLLISHEESDDLLQCKDLRFIMTGGDKVDLSYVNRIINSSNIYIINHYGPTESTVGCSTCIITKQNIKEFNDQQTIGSPISNTQIYILNTDNNLQPKGVVGEICIGGDGLARGYLNQKELTEEKFIDHPFKEGERLYKTGDLGRWLPDETIEFIGRKDDQVKIRGYRIELGEIEYAMSQIIGIKQSCVLVKEKQIQTDTNKYLVGYYVYENKEGAFISSDILVKLALMLPDYMVPKTLVQMNTFPLTTNGKIDKRALPDPNFSYSLDEYIAPNTEIEKALCEVWQEVLGIERIGLNDNFFRIGGNSILAIQLVHRMNKLLLCDVKIADVFRFQSINRMLDAQEQYSGLIKPYYLNHNTDLNNLIFIPPGLAGAEIYQFFSENFKTKFNCIGIDNYNIHSENKIDSLNKLANQYLLLYGNKYTLKEPVNLVGWSLGGLIALEMAAILETKGYSKINVVLLDTFIRDEKMKTFSNAKNDEQYIRKIKNEMLKKYEETYVEKVLAAYDVEKKIAEGFITKSLKHTHVLLFKAFQKEERHRKNKANSSYAYDYLQSLSKNNVNLIADKINVINVDCHHENIIETKGLKISEYILSEENINLMIKI